MWLVWLLAILVFFAAVVSAFIIGQPIVAVILVVVAYLLLRLAGEPI
jgi:uncharacterized membrane protein